MNKLIAIFCMVLIICTPLSLSAEIVKDEDYDEQETGDTITINVRSYEPTVLTSNLIEDNNVPVYVFLSGSTIGTLAEQSPNIEPVYGGIEIEKMVVEPVNIETEDLILDSTYYKPNKFDIDTLGYVVVTLKQFDPDNFEICSSASECDEGYMCETGACIPQEINMTFNADVWFTNAERLYSVSKTALILPTDTDEDEWIDNLGQNGAQYSFYGGRGLIRVKDVGSDFVDLTVYSNKDLYWPIIGAPRAIQDLTLKKGEVSDYIDLGYTDELVMRNAKFRVMLNDVKDPAQIRAKVGVTLKGQRSELVLVEGSSLYPGSSWTVNDISAPVFGREGYEYTIKLKDSSSNVETLTTFYSGGLNEAESNSLSKIFSEKERGKNIIFIDTKSKIIVPGKIGNLDEVFRAFSVPVDTSEVKDDIMQTNKVNIDEGMVLKDVLMAVLPSGYYFNIQEDGVIKILNLQTVDPCDTAEIYLTDGLESLTFSEEQKLDNKLKLDMLCTSVNYFQTVIDNYDDEVLPDKGVSVVDESYLGIAGAYKSIATLDSLSEEQIRGAMQRELESYQALINRGSTIPGEVSFQTEVSNLRSSLFGEATYGTASLSDHGQSVYVELISVNELTKEDLSSTTISKDGIQSEYFVGDALFGSSNEDKDGEYNWYISKVSDESVILKKVYLTSGKTSTKTISNGKSENIDGYAIKVQNIYSKKEAYITIVPGSGQSLHSSTNFSVHIPIEKRLIQLNPDKIDSRIDKAKKLQEKLNKLTEKMNKLVTTWNYACLGVFTFISAKMLFFNKGSSQARQDVVHGFDENSGWAKYCTDSSGRNCQGNCYDSYDKCMLGNSDEIQNDIEKAQTAREYAESLDGNYDNEVWYQNLASGYEGDNLKQCEELMGTNVFVDEETLQDYAYANKLKELGGSSQLQGSLTDSYESVIDNTKQDKEFLAKQEGCNNVAKALVSNDKSWNIEGLSEEEKLNKKEQIASAVYDSTYIEMTTGGAIPTIKKIPSLNNQYLNPVGINVVQVGRVFGGGTNQKFKVYTSTSTVEVTELTYNEYLDILKIGEEKLDVGNDGKADTPSNDVAYNKIVADIKYLDADLSRSGLTSADRTDSMVSDSGAHYYLSPDGKTIYVGLASYSTGSISEKYADDAKLEVFNSGAYKGLPYCLPYKNGNFIKFISYTTNNEIHTIQVWNVGPDGQLCTSDDVLVQHQSEFESGVGDLDQSKIESFANKWVKTTFYEDETIDIDNHKFFVSYGKSKTIMEGGSASCYDVMSPNDCKLLFNTCDPVMCPPSRFNLGGRWQVDNVVETGFIGSVLLGQGNGDVVPVCLTGVLSSLNYWNSMIDGYVECLEAAKYEGKSIGICDKVRQVYICELIVREGAAILDSTGKNGGLLDFLATKTLNKKDSTGGEYLKFKENLQSTQDAVSYFTTDYAATMFAAFKGRSSEEIGTDICKQAIYGKMPWVGDMLGQITTPEDPNQFYASLTVKPYAPSLGTAAYTTYYHIYAGNNANIQSVVYSVYLKNSKTNEIFYTTEKCEGVSSTLELTEMSDQTIDCIAPEGLDTVCVVINGETLCGFGSVTTAFSAEYLKDSIIADEAQREIDSESECYPSAAVASPTVSGIGSLGLTNSLILPYTYGGLSTGIVRVCSLQNPGLGQGNSGTWIPVGTCGTDNEGRLLGTCWLDSDSVSIKDAEKLDALQQHFEEIGYETKKAQLGISNLLSEDDSEEKYISYGQEFGKGDCAKVKSLVRLYEELKTYTTSYTYESAALYQIGMIYYQIGINSKLGNQGSNTANSVCGLVGKKTVNFVATFNGVALGSSGDVKVEEDKENTVIFKLNNLLSTDKVYVSVNGMTNECTKGISSVAECSASFTITSSDGNSEVIISVKDINGRETYTNLLKFYTSSVTLTDTENFEDPYAVCGTCGDGSGYCDVDECHALSLGCYFIDNYFVNDCKSCYDLSLKTPSDACASIEDQTACESSACYNQFLRAGGKCVWSNGACTYSSTSSSTIISTSFTCEATGGADAYENALLDAIASTEGSTYATISGGGTFDISRCSEGHPYLWDSRKPQDSGRYQFIPSTYRNVWSKARLTDFCPLSQDLGSLYIIHDSGVTSDMIKYAHEGNIPWESVLDPIAKTWFGLPYSGTNCITKYNTARPCGGGKYSYDSRGSAQSKENVVAVFERCLAEYQRNS